MSDLWAGPYGSTPLTTDEREGLKPRWVKTRGQLNQVEDANITKGLIWLGGAGRRLDLLDDLNARELHKRLYGDVWKWAGTYRNSEKNIGVAVGQIGPDLRMALGDARVWVECGAYEPVEAAARIHHRLVQIHPFPNGNGRWSRIMADEFTTRSFNAPKIDWSRGTNFVLETDTRRQYIDALRAADYGDFEPLLEYVGA